VRQVAETAIREAVGRSKMDFVLYEGREKVATDVQAMIQQITDRYNLGALITNVTMQGVQPPEQVQSAFDDAVRAGQDRARARNEGEAYANQIIPAARGQAFRLQQDAEAYRSMVVENATGNASRFDQVVAAYSKAPAVTRDRMYVDTMQQIFTNTTKVMIDSRAGNNMLYLPLDKLMQQVQANDAAVGGKSGPVQVPSSAPTAEVTQAMDAVRERDSRSRDSSRDRETR
jgi:membrane protease subunit HflK